MKLGRRKRGGKSGIFYAAFVLCFLIVYYSQVNYVSKIDIQRLSSVVTTVAHGGKRKGKELATLRCDNYDYYTDQKDADDMVYWYNIPQDESYINPFLKKNKEKGIEQFLLFQQDNAGFNNRRMSIETIITMGLSMGRTIVLPPSQPFYMFWEDGAKNDFSFEDFFHLHYAHIENAGVNIITMEEFLQRVISEKLMVNDAGEPIFPPGNRTNWNGLKEYGPELQKLKDWIEQNAYSTVGWDSNNCMTYWPKTTMENADLLRIKRLLTETEGVRIESAKPTPVNASIEARFVSQIAQRRELCLYDEQMQSSNFLYFKMDYDVKKGNRFLSPFYTFNFYEDWREALWMKRFVRDHLRYHDELMCAAARVVGAIRKRVRARGFGDGKFYTMHVRRGDFAKQFGHALIPPEELNKITEKYILEKNSTIYIATDEKNRTYFDILTQHYDICFLDDFANEVKGINRNLFGIIDQITISRGELFFGTDPSTLSAYANRLRGYYSNRDKLEGHEQGKLKSYYFSKRQRHLMLHYLHIQVPLWAHEFSTSWTDIDHDVSI